uniref:SCP domain-containing protein n=1 Tax=Mesocestoides corti TaxID=53468 RepID=A0A5K3FXT3_MESCO
MVWATTTEVGCSIRKCSEEYYLMCIYRPGNDTLLGRPYEEGASCSKCPEGYGCYRNQCSVDALPVTDYHTTNPQTNPETTVSVEITDASNPT